MLMKLIFNSASLVVEAFTIVTYTTVAQNAHSVYVIMFL